MNPASYAALPSSACTVGSEGSFGPDRITQNQYDDAGRLTVVKKAVGTALEEDYATYTYSQNGNRLSMTDARGFLATMEFDGYDRQTRWNFPSPTSPGIASTTDYEQYGYDLNGNRTSLRKRDGSVLTYQYDALNRQTLKIVPERAGLDSANTRDVYFGYDAFGRMTYARFDSASGQGLSMGYDGFGRLTSLATALPGISTTLSFLYDADGNRTSLTYGDGNYVTYGYDGLDRSLSIFRSGNTTLVNYGYDAAGRRLSMDGGYTTSYAYEPSGRLSHLSNATANAGYTVGYSFNYNPASQITNTTTTNNVYAWTGSVNTNRSYFANGLNQYTSAGSSTFNYDPNGNLTSDGTSSYLYDIENRLVSASGAKNAQLRYDPLGRLYESSGAAGTTRFAYDGDALCRYR